MAPMPSYATYSVLVDWFADGDFTDAIDDVSSSVLGIMGGTEYGIDVDIGRDVAISTGPPMIGAADFTLNNIDRSFSPENASGPRYQFIKPGRPVQIKAKHGTRDRYRAHTPYREHDPYRGIAVYGLIVGNLETLTHDVRFGSRIAAAAVLSTVRQLQRRVVSVDLKGSTRTDTAVGYVLDAAGWPSSAYTLHVSDSIINGFWVNERPAWDVIVELVATEGPGCVFYQDGDGMLYWKNRNHRVTQPRSTTVQATLHDGGLAPGTGIYGYERFDYDPRWAGIATRATVKTVHRQLAAAPEVIWKLGQDFNATATPLKLWVHPEDPFQAAIAPVAGTDYTLTGGTATVTLNWTGGLTALITVTATSGSPLVSGLQLRAFPFRVVGETQIESRVTPSSTADEKTIEIAAWPELTVGDAQAICDSYMARYKENRPLVTVTILATNAATLEQVLEFRISDRVRIVNQHLGFDQHCFVEKLHHEIRPGGEHRMILSCEPVSAIGTTGAVWDHPAARWDNPGTLWGT